MRSTRPGHGWPELVVGADLRAGQGGQRGAVRGEGPADEADAPTDAHDLAEDVDPGAPAQGQLVEPVDLALDGLGDLEVAGRDLVDEGRQEVAGVEDAQRGLVAEPVGEALEGEDRAAVDG